MGVSDDDRILREYLYVSKVKEQKHLLINFRIKGRDYVGTEQTFEKAATIRRLDEAAAVDHELREQITTLTLSWFFYIVIFIHKLDIIRKEYVFW